jgi:hypothetical protein
VLQCSYIEESSVSTNDIVSDLARTLRDGLATCISLTGRAAQRSASLAAEGVDSAEGRIPALTAVGRRLTDISHRCADQLLAQGLAGIKGALTDGAERLRLAAQASDLASLYHGQRATLPASRARITQELQATWRIVALTTQELAELARSARVDLAGGTGTAATQPPRPRRRPRSKPVESP